MRNIDLLIIGAGPAGLAAAAQAAGAGLDVWLVDEHALPGGQVFRNVTASPLADAATLLGADYLAGRRLVDAALAGQVHYLCNTQVWQVTPEKRAFLLTRGQDGHTRQREVQARFILACTGALERALPLPGWTLPGAMTVGAAQLLMKSAGLAPPRDAVLMGNGPLLLLFAAQVSRAGGKIQAIIDTTSPRHYLRSLPFLPAALRHTPGDIYQGWRLLREIRAAGIPYFSGARDLTIEGTQQVEAVGFSQGRVRHRLETGTVLSHAGVIPAIQLAGAMGCRLRWDGRQQYWYPDLDTWRQTSVAGVYMAGDGAGITGAKAAESSGRLAALGIIRAAGAQAVAQAGGDALLLALAQQARRTLRRQPAIRRFLAVLYPPPGRAGEPTDSVVLCRCEQITAGDIRAAARQGCGDLDQLKIYTRCGMGPCQGRMCADSSARLLAQSQQRPIDEVGVFHQRFPLKPVSLADIAASDDGNESD